MRHWLWLVLSRLFTVLWPRWNVTTWFICPKKKSFTKARLLASIYSWCLPSAHEILRNTTFLWILFTGSSVCWCLRASLHWDVHTNQEERDIHKVKQQIQKQPCYCPLLHGETCITMNKATCPCVNTVHFTSQGFLFCLPLTAQMRHGRVGSVRENVIVLFLSISPSAAVTVVLCCKYI